MHSDILFETLKGKAGQVGLITLNRPEQLNALNLTICKHLDEQLAAWATQDTIKAVIIRGVGKRAFCAGGDLKYIYQHRDDVIRHEKNIFSHEYGINRQLFHYPKPYVALTHGITMGGGVGVSLHGSHRVGAPGLRFAMPETGIGFYPDIGASYFLSRCPDMLGLYLGLTGAIINHDDAFALKFIDHIIPHERFNRIIEQITDTDLGADPNATIKTLLTALSVSAKASPFMQQKAKINDYFNVSDIKLLFAALRNSADEWATATLKTLQKKSPISLCVTLEQWRRGKHLDFNACMAMEHRLTRYFLKQPNFMEGIRAVLIDKDYAPLWQPDTIDTISTAMIAAYFE